MPLSFRSLDELFVYVVAVLCGISMLMPINAIFSAPAYILFFYRYAANDPDAVAHNTNFWANVLTYYNLISLVTSIIVELLTLSPAFARIPVWPRMFVGLIILVVEIALFLIVPAAGTSETGAIATICVGGLISGVGKSIFEATVYGVFGAFPPRYLAAVMGGAGISGALTSVLQMIVRGALQSGYEDVRTQSKIYYGLSVGIQGTTFICLIFMRWSRFAQHHSGTFVKMGTTTTTTTTTTTPPATNDEHAATTHDASSLSRRAQRRTQYEQPAGDDESHEPGTDATAAPAAGKLATVTGVPTFADAPPAPKEDVDDGTATPLPQRTRQQQQQQQPDDTVYAVTEQVDAQMCGSAGLARVDKLHVFRAIWPLFMACALVFGTTLLLYPTLVVYVDPNDYWYGTVIMLIFNICDAIGRFAPTLSLLRPRTYQQRWLVLAGALARLVLVPLLVLASYHYIPSKAFNYVMTVVSGLTNGYVGAVAMVVAPLSPQLRSSAERFICGTMMGISILIGGAIGTAFSILVQSVRV